MTKPRRREDIRRHLNAYHAERQNKCDEPRPNDWRKDVLDAVLAGQNIKNAAKLAGVSRSRIHDERYRCDAFGRAFLLARYYAQNKMIWISRPLWPPSPQTVQRHDATFRLINGSRHSELVGSGRWR